MHGSKTYLWYTDKRTVGANFNPAPNGTRIPAKKIKNNNIFLMLTLSITKNKHRNQPIMFAILFQKRKNQEKNRKSLPLKSVKI